MKNLATPSVNCKSKSEVWEEKKVSALLSTLLFKLKISALQMPKFLKSAARQLRFLLYGLENFYRRHSVFVSQ